MSFNSNVHLSYSLGELTYYAHDRTYCFLIDSVQEEKLSLYLN